MPAAESGPRTPSFCYAINPSNDHFVHGGESKTDWTKLAHVPTRSNFPQPPDHSYAFPGLTTRLSTSEARHATSALSHYFLPVIEHPVAVRDRNGIAFFEGKRLREIIANGPVFLNVEASRP